MGDMGDLFNDWRKVKQEKRSANRQSSAEMLRGAGIAFEERNGGAHLIVEGRVDFWPGTGLWIQRGTNSKQRGVQALIRFIRATQET